MKTIFVAVILLFSLNAVAQNESQVTTLVVEHKKSHKQFTFTVGQMMKFKTRSSKHFEKGRIVRITDSTVSVESKNRNHDVVSIKHKDFVAFKIPPSETKKIAAGVLTAAAAVWIIYGYFNQNGYVIFLLPITVTVGILVMTSHRKIKLGRVWALGTSK